MDDISINRREQDLVVGMLCTMRLADVRTFPHREQHERFHAAVEANQEGLHGALGHLPQRHPLSGSYRIWQEGLRHAIALGMLEWTSETCFITVGPRYATRVLERSTVPRQLCCTMAATFACSAA